MFNVNNLNVAWDFFKLIFFELIALFLIISFIVALLQRYISKDTIKKVLTKPHKRMQNVIGAALGAVTPFCSCSTIPILVGLFKSGAPFGGTISFLISSPVLNPMIIILFLKFFGLKATAIYFVFTFIFATLIGALLEKLGMEKEIKNVTIQGSGHEDITYDKLTGTRFEKHKEVARYALKDTLGLFVKVIPFLVFGAGVGAFIYGFVPQEFIVKYAGPDNFLAVPTAAVIGVPMYVRTETMIPIAKALNASGMSIGAIMALVIGGAGASIPEVTLLNTIFRKKMVIAFVIAVFSVATITGIAFNIIL
ncbi:permease [Acidaminobacter sp. JC074]|uniref:permease n=1 Tax=Acidaminobacter sp. JC074 TaxID=2530199 RepID=UPI001F1088AE|nr:permease [Acidaminobacter sp. JC074]MCH4887542.1 permease [Acidaminobacter sp. JC074]